MIAVHITDNTNPVYVIDKTSNEVLSKYFSLSYK